MSEKDEKKPNLEYYKKAAKKLVRDVRRRDRSGIEKIKRWHPSLDEEDEQELDAFKLSDAQFVIARSLGDPSWPALRRRAMGDSTVPQAFAGAFFRESSQSQFLPMNGGLDTRDELIKPVVFESRLRIAA